MLLPGFGEEGQRRLLASHALIVGCGALGTVIADALCRAGVGTLTIVDRDVVEWTNLQRQTLFDEADAREGGGGAPKAVAAARRLAKINSGVRILPVVADFSPGNAEMLLKGEHPDQLGALDQNSPPTGQAQVVLDGTDNLLTRYLLNDLAVRRGVPYVYGGAVGTTGMQATILPGTTACLRCVFEEPPTTPIATCDTAGVLGPVAGVVANAQATDALKVLIGRLDLLSGTILEFDTWLNRRRRISIADARREDCPCCGKGGGRFEFLDGSRWNDATLLCGGDPATPSQGGGVQIMPAGNTHAGAAGARLDLAVLRARLTPHGDFSLTPFMLRGVLRDERADDGAAPLHLTAFRDGRIIVRGTSNPARARGIYAKYIGI